MKDVVAVFKRFLTHPASLFSIYMALFGGNFMVYHLALPIRISYHLLMTGILIWWIWRDGLPSTPLLWPLGALAVTTGVSAFNSIDPRIALESWWHWLVNGLLALMLIQWMRRGWGEKLFKAHFAVGGVIIAASLIQAILTPGVRVGGPFLLINLTGAYAAALLVPAFIWWWAEKRLWLFTIATGLVAVLFLNESRGAFVSAGVAVVAFLLLRYRVKLPVLLTGGAIVLLLAFGVMKMTPGGHAAGDIIRQDIWRSALAMLRDNPLTGVGPGLFGQAYRSYRGADRREDNMTGAHSIYLNILAELGVPGGIASALTGAVFLRSLARRRTAKQDAILAALAGIAAHLLFDNFPASNFVFLVSLYVAYLVGEQTQTRVKPALKVAAARVITGVLCLFGFSFALMDVAQFYYEESYRNHSLMEARVAADLDPNNRVYHIRVARFLGDKKEVRDLDPTLSPTTNLWVYGIINFGRALW